MFQNILVPLDGSYFAETALPYALALATKFDSKLTIARVAQGTQAIVPSNDDPMYPDTAVFISQLGDDLDKEAQEYLQSQCNSLRQQGYKTQMCLLHGSDIAMSLLEVVKTHAIDVVVMCTHGRGGIKRWIFGSVAEKVLRQTSCPILLIRADETAVANWQVGTQDP
ncbi:MAG: universal stress protein [Anaerolineales bacterium]|nr:universal stress protein [Anaerolineales bacterium]